jgi:hypothetical protein
MRTIPRNAVVTIIAFVGAMAACIERVPTEPGTASDKPSTTPHLKDPVAVLTCNASVTEKKVSCAPSSPASDGRKDAVLVGGQGVFVQLTSSNASYSSVDSTFKFDVTVQNLIPQPLSTTDGATADGAGVRVFFSSGPSITDSAGIASVVPDGFATFTAAGQAYYQYSGADLGADGILSQNETSAPKQWTVKVGPNRNFTFLLLVSAEVPFPNGYVDVTPVKDTIETGETLGLTATIRNYLGVAVAGSVTWSTSNGSAATVDGSGIVTGAGAGAANIIATAGARSGSATINVCPALAVGGTFTASMPVASDLCFAGGGSGAEYTYVPINHSTSSNLSLTVTGTGISAVTGPPSPNVMVPSTTLLAPFNEAPQQSLGFETTVASDLPYLGADDPKIKSLMADPSSRIKRGSSRDSRIRYSTAAAVPAVGDSISFHTNTACSPVDVPRRGVVRTVSQHLIIVADTANPAGGFTTAQYDSIALEFDSIAYAVDTLNFGAPTDLDGNGHVIAFYTRAVNELSPPASSVIVTGFFSSKDLFSSASCFNSNQAEMFYMLVPDTAGVVNSNVRTVSSVRGGTVGTLGHEFQHLINAWRRGYIIESTNFEEGWLNEGLSHIAEELMFYRTSAGLGPQQNIILSQLNTGPNASRRVAAFNTYANANYGRFRGWLQRPDTAGAFESGHQNSLAVRGAIWAFLRYATDRKNIGDPSFFFGLVNNNLEGVANLQNSIGADPHDWLRDWATAQYNDDAVTGNAATYTNASWNFRSVYSGLGGFPLGTRPLTNGIGLTLSYSRDGGTSFVRFGVPAGGFAAITALSGGVPPSSPYTLQVTRTK